MKRIALAFSAAAAFAATTSATFAQSAAANGLPTVENGGLIPAGLIVWLLPITAVISAGLVAFVDRKMRSGKVSI